ncbi:hypothetical protein [Nocardia aurea]|uniref:Uncharacterized protein n=1 Tax=Nocardia aurea TaxID=2144174 RepID=A0ABV3G5B3_9NOCA
MTFVRYAYEVVDSLDPVRVTYRGVFYRALAPDTGWRLWMRPKRTNPDKPYIRFHFPDP